MIKNLAFYRPGEFRRKNNSVSLDVLITNLPDKIVGKPKLKKVKRQYGNLNEKKTSWVRVVIIVRQKLLSFCNEEKHIT